MADTSEQGRIANRIANGGAADSLIFDPWLALSFKRAIGDRTRAGVQWENPPWVGAKHGRRLTAYKLLQSYVDNASRHFLATGDNDKIKNHREYGDAALIVETIRAALLGDSQEVLVEGAEKFNAEQIDVAANPDAPNPDPNTPSDAPAPDPDLERAAKLQDILQQWANDERLQTKMVETERHACALGDGVFVLGWDAKKGRPRLRTYHPRTYFPVLTDDDDEFPRKLHLAWELEDDANTTENGKRRVRRITWELVDVDPYSLDWNDDAATVECVMSDGIWEVGPDTRDIDDFTEQSVTWLTAINGEGEEVEIHNLHLGIDFIPVVHMPNSVALENHYGRSVLTNVLQILDDIASTDTDLQSASSIAGFPPIGIGKASLDSDAEGKVTTYGPGSVFEVGEGSITAVDVSNGLTALIAYINHLLERLEINARTPAGLLGRVKPNEVPSGIALALSFGPLKMLIDEMRLVRNEKYRVLLRFVVRMLMLWGDETIELPEHVEPQIAFGSYLPADKREAAQHVQTLLTAHAISRLTALQILIEAGFPIDDAAQEIARIQSEDFSGAQQLDAALQDLESVYQYLGRTPSDGARKIIEAQVERAINPPTPPVDQPPTPDEPPAP